MRQSQLFTKTRKEAPKDEVSKNAELLIRAGYIHKEMAGVYSYLPLGLRVLENIKNIIRGEMNAIGGQEVLMPSLQNPDLWKATNRWDDSAVDVWFKSKLKVGGDVGLAWTHEEPLTAIMRQYVSSYSDLPKLVYQFQWKLRNEERAKSGIMRGREFLMKDLYTFASSEEEHTKLYETVASAYDKVFARLGIGERTYRTFASGGAFSKYSHEYQCLLPVGEDVVFINEAKRVAVNGEVKSEEVLKDLSLAEGDLKEERAVEVGNIFSLGTRFSDALELKFRDSGGSEKSVTMGCYGLGPTRIMGVIAEVFADDRGLAWPKCIAPYAVHLVSLAGGNKDIEAEAERVYEILIESGIEVLYDDRDLRAGEKFADGDLIGIPSRLVISEKTVADGRIEIARRPSGKVELVSEGELVDRIRAA